MSRRFVSGLLVPVFAALLAPAAAAAGTLDQQQTIGGAAGLQINGSQSLAQTFTAGLSGGLDQVDLSLQKGGMGPTVPLTVEIRNAQSGVPGGAVLATGSVPASSGQTPPSGVFVPVTFATPAPVTAGTQYAIIAYASGADGSHFYTWGINPAGGYAAGSVFFVSATPPGTTWTDFAPADSAFKTYVTPPAATGKRAAALKKCKKKKSKKQRKKCKRKAKKLPV